jgi:hypothetical protein
MSTQVSLRITSSSMREMRTIVERVVSHVCDYRGWQPFVAHARANHIHSVVAANCLAEAVALSLKS